MRRIKTILISLAAFAAATPATRADELSDLVAAVAASVDSIRMANDVMAPRFDTGKPRYSPKPEEPPISTLLDGILLSMEHRTSSYSPPSGGQGAYLYFFRPVPGVITSRFGWREQFQRVHHGVDLALEIGDTVRAALSGTVERISYDHDGYGHYVVLTHPDGMETIYAHLLNPVVGPGDFIHSGQAVGIGGNTGNSTGPHLHFEVKIGGIALDPLTLFDFDGTGQFLFEDIQKAETLKSPKTPLYTHQQKSLKKESTYIVRVGDTPESVARQAGISVMRLRQLNMLSPDDPLPVGRMLKLK